MKSDVITKPARYLTVLLALTFTVAVKAQIIGPSVKEVKYSYTANVEFPIDAKEYTDEKRAQFHAQHMFGIFHSPRLTAYFGINSDLIGGIGAPRSQMKIKIISSEVVNDKIKMTYENSGRMILHNNAAKAILKDGYMELPMPVNPYEIYDESCTDEHYTSFGDYWYFYDPFRDGCEYLSFKPKAEIVNIKIEPSNYKNIDKTPKLPMLRGNNKNGSLFLIYAIHGFESSPKKLDEGRLSYNGFNSYLVGNGFKEDRLKPRSINSLNIYTKKIKLDNGETLDVEVRHLLANTSISSGSTVFAKFFKEAVKNADVILYGGHSGLGGNLDLELLQEKAGPFEFNSAKKQLFFFDSCSSYSYYLEHFAVEKTKAKIDILSYGLSSYFHTSNVVWSVLMDYLLSPKTKDVKWNKILLEMEQVLEGETYLLNVGGI